MRENIVVWAIDPLENESKPDPRLVAELMEWSKSSGFKVQPVYVLSLPTNETEDMINGTETSLYVKTAEKTSEIYLRELGVRGTDPVKVIFTQTPSRKNQVEELIKISDELNSPCIVVSSHGRSGVQRIVLGSFAETLLLQSKRPVFFLTHLRRPDVDGRRIKKVLFATDFSEFSYDAFRHFVNEAKRSRFEIVLFNSVSLPSSTLAAGFGPPLVIPEDYFPVQSKWADSESRRWAQIAESEGVQTSVIVKDNGVGSNVAESIIEAARAEKAEIIAMASVSGAFSATVMGSIARDVFRANRYPVWVYGPKSLQKSYESDAVKSALA